MGIPTINSVYHSVYLGLSSTDGLVVWSMFERKLFLQRKRGKSRRASDKAFREAGVVEGWTSSTSKLTVLLG